MYVYEFQRRSMGNGREETTPAVHSIFERSKSQSVSFQPYLGF